MNSLENVVYKGKSLVVTKSSDSCTGYENVIQLRIDGKGRPLYAAKFKVDGEPGQRHCPQSLSRVPQESAAALAYFKAGYLGPMPAKKKYAPRRTSEVCSCLPVLVHPSYRVCFCLCVCRKQQGRRSRTSLLARHVRWRRRRRRGSRASTPTAGGKRPRESRSTSVGRPRPAHRWCASHGCNGSRRGRCHRPSQ